MTNIRQNLFGQTLYFWLLAIIVAALPLSPFVLSVSQILIAINWLVSGDYPQKIRRIKEQKAIWVLLILPLLHLIWLANTTDFAYALHDLKIKLPLLLFPIVVGTSEPLTKKQINLLLRIFTLALVVASLICMAVYLQLTPVKVTDIRDISIFISHIRFGLMIVFALIYLLYAFRQGYDSWPVKKLIVTAIAAIWLFGFLFILQSITSWVILLILLLGIFLVYQKRIKHQILRLAGLISIITILTSLFVLIGLVVYNFNKTTDPPFNKLPTHSKLGSEYKNDTTSLSKENGHYVMILIAWDEMERAWPQVSQMPLNGKDNKGQLLKSTLLRYLASKGLPRDYYGVLALEPEDIEMIENGYASVVYRSPFKPYVKLHELLWELDNYRRLNDPNGKSVAMRIEFLHTALYIIKQNFWTGVGTGDVAISFKETYKILDTKLKPMHQLRTHNQYLTFFVSFGVFGFLLSIYSMFAPAFYHRKKGGVILLAFIGILLLSMLNEDTLETQAGVTFFISFYCLLLFSEKP